MDSLWHRFRPLVFAILLSTLLIACERPSSSSPAGDPEPDGGAEESALSGEAGTATLRIEHSGSSTSGDSAWEVTGEFPITLYFSQDDVNHLFVSTGQGTGIMTTVGTTEWGGGSITMNITAILDVEFEVRGAFIAEDCSMALYVKEVWKEGSELIFESQGVVLEGITDMDIVDTTHNYEYQNIEFPFGVGEVTSVYRVGNINRETTFTITSLNVPEFTNCGTFDYLDEEDNSTEIGN
jgi:hypothetical protein